MGDLPPPPPSMAHPATQPLHNPQACQTLEKKDAAVVVIESEGTVVYISSAGEQMFGWSLEDIKGLNVKVLMGEPYASHHDGFLCRFQLTPGLTFLQRSPFQGPQ